MTTQHSPSGRWGQYQEIRPLGEGGFAQVYQVKDDLGRSWALKQIKESLLQQDPKIRERFEREARIQAGLKHPHIAGIHSFDSENGYLVIEFIEGMTLRKLVEDEFPDGMDFDTALKILQPLEDALTYIHEQAGFAHLDVTPRNILIQETRTLLGKKDRHVVLADFGLARVINSNGQADPTIFAGTPGYCAPEQQGLSSEKPGTISDIYALGMVIGFMLTGQSPEEVRECLRDASKTLPPGLTPEVRRVLQRATDNDPQKRYKTVKGLVSAFTQAVNTSYQEKTRTAPSEGLPFESTRRSPSRPRATNFPGSIVATRTRKVLLSLGALVIIAALLLAGWAFVWNHAPTYTKRLGGLPDLLTYCQSLHYPENPANVGNSADLYCGVSINSIAMWTSICNWQFGGNNLTARPKDPKHPDDPHGMNCYGPQGNDKGGVDLSAYCTSLYSASSTIFLAGNSVYDWQCRQKIDPQAACRSGYPGYTDIQTRFEGGSYYCYTKE